MSEFEGQGRPPEYIAKHAPDRIEAETDFRKESIILLTSDLLAQRNPNKDRATMTELMQHISGAYGENPLEDVIKEATSIMPDVKNVADAIAIAQYYWESEEEPVPGAVTICEKDGRKFDVNPTIKTLVFVDDGYKAMGKKDDKIRYEENDVGVAPDIYISNLALSSNSIFLKRTIEITGFDNVLFRAALREPYTNDKISNLDIRSSGNIVLMEGARLVAKTYSQGFIDFEHFNITMETPGDVIMNRNAVLGASRIHCNNFIQNGGELVYPIGQEGVKNAPPVPEIKIDSEDRFNGGTRHNKIKINTPIEEARRLLTSGDEQAGEVEDTAQVNAELAEDAHMDRDASSTTKEELSEMFDSLAEPQTKIVRVEEGGDVEIRGYDMSEMMSGKKTELATYAAASGWKILSSTDGMLIVQRLQKLKT